MVHISTMSNDKADDFKLQDKARWYFECHDAVDWANNMTAYREIVRSIRHAEKELREML